jgi:hypothetical protein
VTAGRPPPWSLCPQTPRCVGRWGATALSTLGLAHSHVHALRVRLEKLSKYKEECKEEWGHPAFLIVLLKIFRSWTTQQPPSDQETY